MRKHANYLNMPHDEYLQHYIDRWDEIKGKKIPKTFRDPKLKRTKIKASNPVLVVGAGPSYSNHLKQIKEFPGKVIIFDVNYNFLVSHDIIPDYALSLEVKVRPVYYNPKYAPLVEGKTKFIFSSISHISIIRQCIALKQPYERWISMDEPRFSNVGTFGINYAKQVLKADKIFIIGFEHDGVSEDEPTWEYWIADFWHFVKQWPKELIVNCTDAGKLYLEDYILDSTLDSLVTT